MCISFLKVLLHLTLLPILLLLGYLCVSAGFGRPPRLSERPSLD